jgi:CysZ protein
LSPIVRSLFKALFSLLHPKMLLLMLLPVVAALLIWLGIGLLFWQQAVGAIDSALQTWPSLTGFQWVLNYWPLTLVAAHVAVVVLALLMVPVILVTTVLVVGIFAMPVMVTHVAEHGWAACGMAWWLRSYSLYSRP